MTNAAPKTEKTEPMAPIPAAVAQLIGLGIVPLTVEYKGKAPTATNWPQAPMPQLADVPYQFAGNCNVGAVLGERSGWLVDIDFDWPEAARLAPSVLPVSWSFGRDNAGLRHTLFRSPGAASFACDAPAALYRSKKGRRIIELLSSGRQVVVPPSVHESGAQLRWSVAPDDQPLTEIGPDELKLSMLRIAGTALLARHWPEFEGSRHDLVLALAGALHHAEWPRSDIEKLLTAFLQVVDDPERRDRARAIINTLDRAEAGQAITGWPHAAELLGDALAGCLQQWWKLGNGSAVGILTFGGRTAEEAAQQLPQDAGLIFGSNAANGASSTSWTSGMDWPELLEFESNDAAEPSADYPVDAHGPIIGPAVNALAERQQVPLALAAQSCLGAAAAVVQERFDVHCDGRTIPLSIWLVLVAVPGERKTSTDAEAFRLIHLRMREAEVRYQVLLAAWIAATKGGDGGDPGPPPRKPSWLLTNCTTEGLLKTLSDHWPALTLTNSDAASWVSGYSMREGRDSATGAVLSNLWSGAYQSTAKASQDLPVTLNRRRLSVLLMLQPEVAAALFENRTLTGQGFLSRCLPAFPPSLIGSRPYRRRTADARLDLFDGALDALLAVPTDLNLITGELTPRPLPLDDTAFDAWVAVHDRMEADLAGDYRDIVEVANKGPEQVLRLAGVQAALEGAEQVQVPHIERAAQLVNWYLSEWQRLTVRLVEHRREVALPRQLLDWMRRRRAETGQDVFKLRMIYKSGPRMVRGRSQRAQELMNELLRRGYVRMKGTDYELRPDDV